VLVWAKKNKTLMKKVILIYGSIAGVIVGAMFFITAPLYDNGAINFDNGMWVGYTSMVIALSLIFFGVKTYRDSHARGVVSFGTAFKTGILITVVASVIYALSWEVAYRTVSKGFTQKMQQYYVENLKREITDQAELKEELEKQDKLWLMYENPIIRFGMTLMEIFPVGLVITLLSAGLLRKKEFLSETATPKNSKIYSL
jgi:Protein of unknown function (DUF4199)